MRKLFRKRDILFLGLAGVGDFFEEVADGCGLNSWCYREVYGFVPGRYRKHNFTRLVNRSLKTGDLERVTRGEETYLRLTARGYNAVHRDFPVLSLQNKPWDGKWRIVAFDIAEINHLLRQALREKLKNLGFGMLQKSIWLTPHDIIADFRDFLEYHHLEDSVYAFETDDLLAGDEKELATKVWKLKKLNQAYESLLDEINMLQQPSTIISDRNKQLKARVTDKMQKSRYENKIRTLKDRYLRLLLSDPCLPKELLPDDWAGETVREKIRELKSDKIN